jgi:mono/diheme cytochrome c family protein
MSRSETPTTATSDPPVTNVEIEQRRRRRWLLIPVVLALVLMLIGLAVVVAGLVAGKRLLRNSTTYYADNLEHFERGSIGADEGSGLPYWVWQALPRLFPAEFNGRLDYQAFGFLYRTDRNGRQEDLPIGISKRNYQGVDLVWFNCAICHTGTYRTSEGAERVTVAGMPSNNLDLYRFIRFILDAGVDERLKAETLIPAVQASGADLGFVERKVWQYYVIPRVREGFIERQSRLHAFLAGEEPWGPGRVDTFNPYKLVQMRTLLGAIAPYERHGASDFPSIFYQRPRKDKKMELHWDGNNPSLDERNLSAALGAGVTPKSVDHKAIERVADWLLDLRPPASPHRPDPGTVARGRARYMTACAACHGYQGEGGGYVFEGANLGKVEPIAKVATDRGRLDSYTEAFRQRQLAELFAGTPYQFKYFVKTDGYANQPLDGLWLRGPYLHNGSVPTLRDLLAPPAARPAAFVRGIDLLDGRNGGFVSPSCTPGQRPPQGFCYDTRVSGNGNGGHDYGTTLSAAEKDDLIAYLLTF